MPSLAPVRSLRQRIGLVLGIVLFLAMLLAPSPEGLKPEARRMAAVALLMATWWITEPIAIALTSLLPLALFPLLGILPSEKVAPYYADHTIYLFFGGFVVALAIQKWNLHKRIALHTIHCVGSQPSRLLLGFMLATAFLSMWMSNTACAMMMFPIGMAVVLQLAGETGSAAGAGLETGKGVTENFGSVLMLGIAYSASLGGMATLIGTPPNIVFVGAVRRLFPKAPEVGFLQWMAVGLPLVMVFVPVAWFYLCRFASRIPLRQIQFRGSETVIEDELKKLGKITYPEKIVLTLWTVMALLWIFRSPIRLGPVTIPGWSQLFGQSAYLHDATVAMVMALLLCLISIKSDNPEKPGTRTRQFLMDWETVRQGVPWGILLLFGGGFAMAAGFEQTGLSSWIGSLLGGLQGLPPILMMVASCFLLTFLTEVTSNTATATMAMPFLAAVAVQLGIHPYLLMICGAISASCAFMLPVATPPNAIVFGSGWVTIPQMARTGLALNFIGIVLVTAAVYLLGMPVFGISPGQLPDWVK